MNESDESCEEKGGGSKFKYLLQQKKPTVIPSRAVALIQYTGRMSALGLHTRANSSLRLWMVWAQISQHPTIGRRRQRTGHAVWFRASKDQETGKNMLINSGLCCPTSQDPTGASSPCRSPNWGLTCKLFWGCRRPSVSACVDMASRALLGDRDRGDREVVASLAAGRPSCHVGLDVVLRGASWPRCGCWSYCWYAASFACARPPVIKAPDSV